MKISVKRIVDQRPGNEGFRARRCVLHLDSLESSVKYYTWDARTEFESR